MPTCAAVCDCQGHAGQCGLASQSVNTLDRRSCVMRWKLLPSSRPTLRRMPVFSTFCPMWIPASYEKQSPGVNPLVTEPLAAFTVFFFFFLKRQAAG